MYLGIEIGGTKLQLGVGSGKGGSLEALERTDVDQAKGAEGIAQPVTLLAPNIIVIGGRIAQVGDAQFFAPLRAEVQRYVFTPLRGSYEIVPAALGEEVVIHGAIAIAADDTK